MENFNSVASMYRSLTENRGTVHMSTHFGSINILHQWSILKKQTITTQMEAK